jgi:ectoine hydroxylase-related dioxygenase (phytanoyl-CoA dioxygenase family)
VLPEGRVEGVPLKVMELTGQPGDAWLMDLRILHAAAPNGSDRPRLMITHRFVPNARVPEIAEAFGWA